MEKKQKMLVRTDPRVVMPEGFGQAKPAAPPPTGAKPGPTVVTVDKPVQVKSLHSFLANLQYDQVTHFRREKYQPWPIFATEVDCDVFTIPIGTALILTCVRYRITSYYTLGGVAGTVTYFLQDEALMTYFLRNPPPSKAIRTTINGSTIASQQFVYADPAGLAGLPRNDTIVDGYYTLNQNILPPGYTTQAVATENQTIKTILTDPVLISNAMADRPIYFGVEYYGFTIPMTVWNRFKLEYAP